MMRGQNLIPTKLTQWGLNTMAGILQEILKCIFKENLCIQRRYLKSRKIKQIFYGIHVKMRDKTAYL